jgi:hypothetical protein
MTETVTWNMAMGSSYSNFDSLGGVIEHAIGLPGPAASATLMQNIGWPLDLPI